MSGNTREQVREFYDRIGWSQIGEGVYQNARYEDLRPVSREYIHRCHLRVKRHLAPSGTYFLDAGSGPVQYPEYLTYSEGYRYRVCADISLTALREARQRLGDHGLYVVADVAALPFKESVFDGAVSLHTFHHLPLDEHRRAYFELLRVLAPHRTAVVVNGWSDPPLMRLGTLLIRLTRRLAGYPAKRKKDEANAEGPKGTFVAKATPSWLRDALGGVVDYHLYSWRSLSTPFMRWFIRPRWGGRAILRLVYWLEERFPRFFGRYGQYPMVVIEKKPIK